MTNFSTEDGCNKDMLPAPFTNKIRHIKYEVFFYF